MIVSGPVLSEVASGSVGSIRSGSSDGPAGVSWGTSAVSNADVIIAVATTAASAHDGASTTTSNTRSHPRVRSSRKSHTSTANDHRSKANANNSAGRDHCHPSDVLRHRGRLRPSGGSATTASSGWD